MSGEQFRDALASTLAVLRVVDVSFGRAPAGGVEATITIHGRRVRGRGSDVQAAFEEAYRLAFRGALPYALEQAEPPAAPDVASSPP